MIRIMKETAQRAKVFWTGRSQAVRLPRDFRLDVDSVLIHREGNTLVLELVDEWPEDFVAWLKSGPHLSEDFVRPPQGKDRPTPSFDEVPAPKGKKR